MAANRLIPSRLGTVAENTRPAQKSTAMRLAQVFGDVRQGRRWGSDGASLESVSGFSHDPAGYRAGDSNLYRYVFNNPVVWTDPSGLWLDGNAATGGTSSATQGHSDFPGYPTFDWTFGDHAVGLGPIPGTGNGGMIGWLTGFHFMTLVEAEALMAKAVCRCAMGDFERAGHAMQDWFSHAGQGYGGPLGHGPASLNPRPGAEPDNSNDYRDAFNAAKERTQQWLDLWNKCCKIEKSPFGGTCGDTIPGRPKECCDGLPAYKEPAAPPPVGGPEPKPKPPVFIPPVIMLL
jgi:hypothetical protein